MMRAMTRRLLAWLSPLPLIAAGSLAAHGLVYRLAAPAGHDHGQPLSHTPITWYACAALCGAIALVALIGIALVSVHRGVRMRPPYWLVLLVPPLGFAAQEQIGRVFHADALTTLPEASFVFGLLIQLPVALLALWLVRLVLAAAIVAVRALRGSEPRRPTARITRQRPAWSVLVPSLPALALGYGERGPPALLRP
jgi:hypothetical protein